METEGESKKHLETGWEETGHNAGESLVCQQFESIRLHLFNTKSIHYRTKKE